ncbi:MAG: DMT family transporter [Salinivirgaceae bacterium]|nr:DMT family transporter [Salinivirgaceae bacterium]
MQKKYKAWIFLSLTMCFWGMSFIWTRKLLDDFSPITIISLRLFISTVLLFIFSLLIKRLQKIKSADIKWFLLLAIFQPFLYFIFEGYGVKETSASVASIVIATIPLFTPIGDRIIFKQKVSLMNWIGILISFFGVILIVSYKQNTADMPLIGLVYLFGAVFSAVGYMLVLSKVASKYNTFSVATWQNFIGVLLFAPFFIGFGYNEILQVQFSKSIILSFLGLAIFASSLAFIFNTYGVRELGASKAATFTNSVPVFTVVFAYFIINEPVGYIKVIGMATVLLGLILAQRKTKTIKHL